LKESLVLPKNPSVRRHRTTLGEAALEKKDGEGGEIPEEQAEVETGTGNYLIAARKVVRVVLAVFAISLIFWLWGFEMPFEGAVIKAFFNIFVIIMLAYLVWTYIKSAIERKLGPPEEPVGEAASDDPGRGGTREASDDPGRGGTRDRSYTLLPLIQKTIGVVLFVTVVLIVLSSLGVEIGPLLASAGIFGLAIGLGSQTLVRDVVAGIFFIIDDAFRVGDYVTIGSEEGSVVKTSLRALTLRHYKGQIQVITYGDIKSVTNWTRGPMLIKFSLPLPAETNPQKVKKIIKKVNQEMMDDEKFGPNFVEELKSQGVKGIEDGVMTIRVKFRAKPGTQFELKREAYRRIHAALTEAGIKFASRGVTVNIPQSETAQGETAAPGQATTTPAPHPTEMAPSAGAAAATILTDTKKKKRK
jgi:small-conductance mechanosensitive channel